MAEKVQLELACAQGRLIITTERVRFYSGAWLRRGKGWWVARSSISGATTFSDADGQRLTIFTRGGKVWEASRVSPMDALRTVNLLGYASIGPASHPAKLNAHTPTTIKCRTSMLEIGSDRVSLRPRFGLHRHTRPWTVARGVVSGVSCVGVDHAGLLRSLAVYTSGGTALPIDGVSPADTRRIVETLGAFGSLTAVRESEPEDAPELVAAPELDPSATRATPQSFGLVYPSEAMA